MDITIRRAEQADLDLLMKWRMTVLREVFSVPQDDPMTELEQENRRYYLRALPDWDHVACFACSGQEIVGCGGICFYQEMPSPDNPQGGCAYLMKVNQQVQGRRAPNSYRAKGFYLLWNQKYSLIYGDEYRIAPLPDEYLRKTYDGRELTQKVENKRQVLESARRLLYT